MDEQSRSTSRPWPYRLQLLCCAVVIVAVACATFVPQHGWDPTFGPVVPHDTFPAQCSLCHAEGNWQTMRQNFEFDHGERTGVELQGAHRSAGCLMCHNDRGTVQQYAARGCAGCHEDPHLQRLGRNCEDCHDEVTWRAREAIARHDRTRFPLVGAHAAVACFRCHAGAQVGNFAGASTECGQCHVDDRLRATDPNHIALNYSVECQECHLPTGWQPARFSHAASFPLINGHAGRACRECHTTPNAFAGLSTACASCHTDEHSMASEPNHTAASFGTDCSECHDTRTFRMSNWPHPPGLPLTFAHAGRRCTECHANQVYSGTSSDCSSCHLDNYLATQNPNHATVNYPTDCASCHGTASWLGAVGEHPASFPLENAHQRACVECHTTQGVFAGLNPSCLTCHLPEYQATTNPSHTAFMLGQQCLECHGTTTWTPSTFVHQFDINGGPHGNVTCFDCHTNPGNRSQFSCIDCHEHRQTEMNDKHSGVQNYVWTTAACYQCHPDGRN